MSDTENHDNKRRKFLKTSSAGAASVGMFGGLLASLEALANTREDAQLIKKAVSNLETAAKKGAKGKALSLTQHYLKLGGKNKVVVGALKSVDQSLMKANAFEKFDKRTIGKAVSGGLTTYASKGVDVGDVEVNCGIKAGEPIKGSALETMVEYGGSGVENSLRENGLGK